MNKLNETVSAVVAALGKADLRCSVNAGSSYSLVLVSEYVSGFGVSVWAGEITVYPNGTVHAAGGVGGHLNARVLAVAGEFPQARRSA